MIWMWIRGAIATRSGSLGLAVAGIVAATALIGVIGAFGASSAHTMTQRAMSAVPVDWQVAVAAGADASALAEKLPASAAIHAIRIVGYADVAALVAKTGDTTQTTGAGQALGLTADYAQTFPGQIRGLLGRTEGVLLAQQTAANLHVTVGDVVTVQPEGGNAFDVKIDGVVDLPNADAMFQTIGPAKGPAVTAPPDNVVILPMDQWSDHFAARTRRPNGGARIQIHVGIDRESLPASPDEAYRHSEAKARNFEIRAAGAAIVGDNLSARLGAVREDALFARLLLIFLGLPGIVLALLLTASIARADSGQRRREQALLDLRGASSGRIAALAGVEAGLVAIAGSLCGVALAAVIAGAALGLDLQTAETRMWLTASAFLGFAIALAVVLAPALRELRSSSTVARRAWMGQAPTAMWRRLYLDIGLIMLAAAVYWHSASTGYQVVLAPEGVAATAIDYTAFLAPLLFWIGCWLLALRLTSAALRVGRVGLTKMLAPLAGRLAHPAAAALSRQNRRVAAGAALVALAFAFAAATSIFNSTYNAQLLVDAQLTNGADVTVTGTGAAPAGAVLDKIRAVPGVASAEPMQHRFAYVGQDLQDMYGIDPARIANATSIADAYFANGDARATLARLAATPDGVLVSQETVNDFQLAIGDVVNLRLQSVGDRQYKTIPFHFVGVVEEFPTAPHDSFLVANAGYIAAQTGNAAAEIVLARVSSDPAAVANVVRARLDATGLKTTDLSQAVHAIGSSLTAVDLRGLGAVELVFAVLFAAMATGLTLWLGQSERARANAILLSLGASHSEVRSFLWSEGLVMLGAGLLFGAPTGAAAAWMLVRLLSGVFDPPPEALSIPWTYLAFVLCGAIAATIAAIMAQGNWSKEWAARELRAGR
ncbi:MAG TPA: FtsX-like permease family protein [Roseiarcus sp.]|nr:FtsX-like permease family protein [Roseiarcus sp.]